MVKIRIGTTISILVNLFLTFWLVNQYLNDIYFQNYVNSSIGPYSPFIVLTIGLGGGSGFGYVLLKDGTVTKASSERYRNQNPSNLDHYSQQAVRPPRPQDRSSPQALRLPQGQSTQSTQYHHYQRVQPRAVQEPARV